MILTVVTLQGSVRTDVRWSGIFVCHIVSINRMLCIKFDEILLTTFKVTVKKDLAYFFWTRCIIPRYVIDIQLCPSLAVGRDSHGRTRGR